MKCKSRIGGSVRGDEIVVQHREDKKMPAIFKDGGGGTHFSSSLLVGVANCAVN